MHEQRERFSEQLWCRTIDIFDRLVKAIEKRIAPAPQDELVLIVSVDEEVPDTHLPQGLIQMVQFTLTTFGQRTLRIKPWNTKLNKPAKVDGIPTWSVLDVSGSVTPAIEPAADGLSCVLHGGQLLAGDVVHVEATFDADLGQGKRIVSYVFESTSTDVEADAAGASVDEEVAETGPVAP